jgi:hypothetical protein
MDPFNIFPASDFESLRLYIKGSNYNTPGMISNPFISLKARIFFDVGIRAVLSDPPSTTTEHIDHVLLEVVTHRCVQNRPQNHVNSVQCAVQHFSPIRHPIPVLFPQLEGHGGSGCQDEQYRNLQNQSGSAVKTVRTAGTAEEDETREEEDEEEEWDTEHHNQDQYLESSRVVRLTPDVPGLIQVVQFLGS